MQRGPETRRSRPPLLIRRRLYSGQRGPEEAALTTRSAVVRNKLEFKPNEGRAHSVCPQFMAKRTGRAGHNQGLAVSAELPGETFYDPRAGGIQERLGREIENQH